METKNKVLEILKSKGEMMKSGEIAEASGIDKKDVDKAIKILKNENLIESPKRCFYSAK